MKIFAVTGNPIEHSKSPALFSVAYHNNADLKYILLPAQSVEEAIKLFQEKGLSGMNITAPFKTDILQYVDEQSDEVKVIGAANTLVKQSDGCLKLYNTDYQGVSGSFIDFGASLSGKRCLLLGIGGAGKAAAYALTQAGAMVTIANRTVENAQAFAEKINCKSIDLLKVDDSLRNFDIIINTLYPTIDCIDKAWLHASQVVMDASYVGSPLLDKAARRGCRCIDGRYWILHQAIPAYKMFTGVQPDIAAMRKLLGID